MDHDQGPVNPTPASPFGPYRTLGPFLESKLELDGLLQQQINTSWRMCQEANIEYRWIIDMLSADSHAYYALGPFDFQQHQIFEIQSWVTAISVPEHGRLVGTGGHGVICLDRNIGPDAFWIVCMPDDSLPAPADPRTLTLRPNIATSPVNGCEAHDKCPAELGRDPSSSRKRSRTTQPEENFDTTGDDGAAEDGLLDLFLISIEGSAEGAANGSDTILKEDRLSGGSGLSRQRFQNVLDGQGQQAMTESSRKRARLAGDIGRVPVAAYESGQAPASQVLRSVIILEDSDDEGSEAAKYPPVIILEDEGSEMEWSRTDDYTQPGNVDTIGGDGAHGGAGGFQSMLETKGEGSLDLQNGDGGSEQGSSTEVQNVQDQPAVTNSPGKTDRQPTMKNHGVKERQGGLGTTFVAYFRPSALPESDKSFVTVGEFESEDDAWYAFNLFFTVHEGVPSYTKIASEETKLNLDVEASHWSQFHHVALLTHLRLKGRGKYTSEKSPSVRGIPKYRNVKPRWTKIGTKWDCDVMLPKGMNNPNVAKGMKKQRTFDSGHEAAKEADRLMYLREGMMAWTNFALTGYMSDDDKEKLPKTWLPLQDNPKKYLTK